MRIDWKEIPKEETIFRIASKYPGVRAKTLEAYLKMMWFSGQVDRVLESHFAQWNLSRGRFMALMLLYRKCNANFVDGGIPEESALSPSELASQLDVTRGNMTGLIDGLEREGWIRRENDPEDRRGLLIHMTEDGKERLEKMLPVHFERMGKFLSKMTASEADGLLTGVEKLLVGLTDFREEIEKFPKKDAE